MSKKSQAEADQSRQARKRTPTFLLELPLQIDEGQAAHGTQRDLYSAFLAAYLDPAIPIPSCAQYVVPWAGAAPKLWHPQSRSASARKSARTPTRASLAPQRRKAGSVAGTLRTPLL